MFARIFPILFMGYASCALGLGAGVGVTVDTRGTWTVLLSLQANNLGVRVEPQKTPRTEQAAYLNPMEFSGGLRLNGDAGRAAVLRMDLPGVAFSQDELDGGWGYNAALFMRNEITWPLDGSKSSVATGAVVKGAYMHHLSLEQLKRLESRPEWPDGWAIHSIGPGASAALMHDDDGWYGQFTLSMLYEYLNYFYIGL